MMNFRVDDLNAIIKRLNEAGHATEYEGDFPNGRFAKLHDPEGNAIQLWEPGGKDPGQSHLVTDCESGYEGRNY